MERRSPMFVMPPSRTSTCGLAALLWVLRLSHLNGDFLLPTSVGSHVASPHRERNR